MTESNSLTLLQSAGVIATPPTLPGETRYLRMVRKAVLLAEDDRAFLEFMTSVLVSHGFFVFRAENGAKALKIAEALPDQVFDLLLTDIVMPRLDGWDLAARFRKRYPGTRIVFTSAFVEGHELHRYLADTDSGFICKPFTAEQLVRAVLQEIGE